MLRPGPPQVINHRCGDKQNERGKWVNFSDELAHDNRWLG